MKTARNRITVLLAAGVLFLAGCVGPQLFHPQLSSLDKGLTQDEVGARIKLPPLSSHVATANGRTFEFHRYRLNNGVHTELYLLAFEKGRLVFWGYVAEFRRQPDAGLNAALSSVIGEITVAAKNRTP